MEVQARRASGSVMCKSMTISHCFVGPPSRLAELLYHFDGSSNIA